MAYGGTNPCVGPFYPDLDAGFCRTDGQQPSNSYTFESAETCVSSIEKFCCFLPTLLLTIGIITSTIISFFTYSVIMVGLIMTNVSQ